jgi:Fe-S-cluster-containing dehydrogenase component/formate-dependent nitrite reductase membrane component NrfD
MNYGFVIDNGRCIGCHACSTACKSENQVPVGVHRTWVKYVEQGQYPDVRRHFQVNRCNHCANPPCVRICPTAAMFQRADGIVEFDSDACIGCKGCMQACPYDAIHIDPETHTAAKCHMCSHRLDVGLEPACVVVCPEHAILVGDLDDPKSEIAQKLARRDVTVRKPEQGTSPKVFYIHGAEVTLRPGVAQQPGGGMFSDVPDDDHHIGVIGTSAAPARETFSHPRGAARVPDAQGLPSAGPLHVGGRMAEHMVQEAFNVHHQVPWHWPIAAYLVTKHIAGGAFALLALSALLPGLSMGPILSGGAFAILMTLVTLGLLVYDLDRPDRFFFLLLRPQFKSWIARAAWLLTAFSVVTGGWWLSELIGLTALRPVFALLSVPLGWLAAAYTAFLFAQAEGRDLWQGAHLPLVMTAQAAGLGGVALGSFGALADTDPATQSFFLWVGAIGLLLGAVTAALGDSVSPPSENARRALHALRQGELARPYWGGLLLSGPIGALLAFAGLPALALPVASAGVFAWAWGLVVAPQQIPNS